jgi:hypothetical protein
LISPAAALAYLGWRAVAGMQVVARHSAPAQIELLPAMPPGQDPRFESACAQMLALGFTPIGDFEVRAGIGPNTRQRTFLRAFLSPERSAFGIVYELASLTVTPHARAGAQKIWVELVSRKSDAESLTTSSGEPPLALLDPNPQRPVQRFVGAAPALLWENHRARAGMSAQELTPDEFAPRFTQAWTRSFEFQESRGLYRRQGDRFVATRKLAVRSVLEFHLRLRHRKGPAHALLVCAAVAVAAMAVRVAPWPAAAAASAGAAFAVLFRHFELPGALFVAAMGLMLGRDDQLAVIAFLVPLFSGAVLLQRRRAAKAEARLAP